MLVLLLLWSIDVVHVQAEGATNYELLDLYVVRHQSDSATKNY